MAKPPNTSLRVSYPKLRRSAVQGAADVAGPAVRAILIDERLYSDGEPRWLEGRQKRPCQTAAEADTERLKLVNRLLRFGKENPAAIELASRIAHCKANRRCMSGACPECARAWQRWFVSATAAFLVRENSVLAGQSNILSMIHAEGIVQPGELA